jgi:amino acid transporter
MATTLKRELSLTEVICVSAGVMISSGLFVLPAIAYTQAGVAMILSYAIGSLLIIPTILAKSELVTAMPITGGIFIFADRSMGPLMGTIGGLTAWISLAFKSAFSLLAMGIFVVLIKPDVSVQMIKFISVICCLLFTFINLRGVKLSGRFQTVLVILLIFLLILYVITGLFSVQPQRYQPFAPNGTRSVFATAGLVFIAFSGTTKVTAIAGEVKNPGRNLPLGIFYSWGIVSVLYVIVVFVTVGLLEPGEISNTFTPISLGGDKIMGQAGMVIMTIAALLAFFSTGNAGLLAASRNPLAMSRDELLPEILGKVSSKGTPVNAILFTSGIMITAILFLDIETFVKTASALKLILFIIANLSLIFMREANIQHYRPKFISPFYPWAQIFGIISYTFLILQMGGKTLTIVAVFMVCGILWYLLFVHRKIKREYAILHIIEKVTGIKSTDRLLEEELREILIERDNITSEWFEKLIPGIAVINIKNPNITSGQLSEIVAEHLSTKMSNNYERLYQTVNKRFKDPDIIVRPGIACMSVKIKGSRKFGINMIRIKEGVVLKEELPMINALFIVVYSEDEWNYQIHALSGIIEIVNNESFIVNWMNAKGEDELHKVLQVSLHSNFTSLPRGS